MSARPWGSSPAREDGTRWDTVPTGHRVLAVVHNVTAAARLLDILPLWGTDTRIQTTFSCIGSSAFSRGTDEFLTRQGMDPVPWGQVDETAFDLAISASYGGPMHEIRAPLIVLPHGVGYNKYLSSGDGNGSEVFGLSPHWMLHEGELLPSVAILSHTAELERLRGYCPEAVNVALVAGDPCFDRMLASRPLRETYRWAFGARAGQRVVLVSSTWGAASLLGRDLSLIARLARELPMDEYRIVVGLHPNIWQWHSARQVRLWLGDCERAGVVVLPVEESWRAAIVAADITIGDHGSASFYSAALGTPLLLAVWPQDAVDPASPVGQLLTLAPRLDPERKVRPQIEATIGEYSATRYDAITRLATSAPGESARLLRTIIYDKLGLTEPATEAETVVVPIPKIGSSGMPSQLVGIGFEWHGSMPLEVTVTRYPAAACEPDATIPGEVVRVTTTVDPSQRLLQLTEVLILDGVHEDPEHWIRRSVAATYGCVLGAVRSGAGGWLVGDRESLFVRFVGPHDLGPVYAALLHAWVNTRRPIEELPDRARFRLGVRYVTTRIEVLSRG